MYVQSHAAIDAAFLTEQVIRQYLEPIVQDKWLPELNLDGFIVFFGQDLPQPNIEVYIV